MWRRATRLCSSSIAHRHQHNRWRVTDLQLTSTVTRSFKFPSSAFVPPQSQVEQDHHQEEHFRAIVKQGDDMLKQKRYTSAIDMYHIALSTLEDEMRGPENEREASIFIKYRYYVLDCLRECYDSLDEYSLAIKQCDEFFRLEPELKKLKILDQWGESLNYLSAKKAEYLIALKRHDEALIVLNQLIDRRLFPAYKLDKKNEKLKNQLVYALSQRGKIYAQKGDYSKSLLSLEKALTIAPNHGETLSLQCLCLMRTGQLPYAELIAKKVIERSILSTPDFRCRVIYAEILLMGGKYAECIEACNTTLKRYPDDYIPYIIRAQANLKLFHYQNAADDVTLYESAFGVVAVSSDPYNTTVSLKAKALLGLCQFTEADKYITDEITHLDQYHLSEQRKIEIDVLLALSKHLYDENDEARNIFKLRYNAILETVSEDAPVIVEYLCYYARILAACGDLEQAIGELIMVESKFLPKLNISNKSEALVMDFFYATYAEILVKQGDTDDANNKLEEGKSKLSSMDYPTFIHSQIARAIILYQSDTEATPSSNSQLQQLLETVPQSSRAWSYRTLLDTLREKR